MSRPVATLPRSIRILTAVCLGLTGQAPVTIMADQPGHQYAYQSHCAEHQALARDAVDVTQAMLAAGHEFEYLNVEGASAIGVSDSYFTATPIDRQLADLVILSRYADCTGQGDRVLIARLPVREPAGEFSPQSGLRWYPNEKP